MQACCKCDSCGFLLNSTTTGFVLFCFVVLYLYYKV